MITSAIEIGKSAAVQQPDPCMTCGKKTIQGTTSDDLKKNMTHPAIAQLPIPIGAWGVHEKAHGASVFFC